MKKINLYLLLILSAFFLPQRAEAMRAEYMQDMYMMDGGGGGGGGYTYTPTCTSSQYRSGSSCYSCSSAMAGCTSCTSASNCSECSFGYGKQTINGLTKCVPYTFRFPGGAKEQRVKESEYCAEKGYKWVSSGQGGYALPEIKCADKNCSYTSDGVCTTCNSGYYLSGELCPQCPTGCPSCTSTSGCSTCSFGYGKQTINGYTKCLPYTFRFPGGTTEQKAKESEYCAEKGYKWVSSGEGGYALPEMKCADKNCSYTADGVCKTCNSGYYLSGELCPKCPTGCTSCTGASSCTACVSGYTLKNGKCVSETVTGSCPTGLSKSSDGCCCIKY